MWMEGNDLEKLHKYIFAGKMTKIEEKRVKQVIEAFSEYMVATNPSYRYNKTYLYSFVEDFIDCRKALMSKYKILSEEIVARINDSKIEDEWKVTIDGAWKFEKTTKGKCETILNSTFVPECVKRMDKMQLEIELLQDGGFVVAEEIKLDDELDQSLNQIFEELGKYKKDISKDEE